MLSNNHLCQCCLLFISPTADIDNLQKHHPSLEALRESSQNGCLLCVQILDLAIHSQGQRGSKAAPKTQYSWIVEDDEGVDRYAFFGHPPMAEFHIDYIPDDSRVASIEIWPVFSEFHSFRSHLLYHFPVFNLRC